MILSFLTGTIGRYLILAIVGVGFLAWIRADAAAPYKAKVAALEESIARRIQIEQADAERAEADRSEIERLKAVAESLVHETKKTSCHLSAAELERLRKLAASGR